MRDNIKVRSPKQWQKYHMDRANIKAKEVRSILRKPIEPNWNLSSKACTAVRKYKKELV
jgi:hypothetical protein